MKEKDRLYLQDSFLRMLTEGKVSLSQEELNSWVEGLSLPMHGSAWFCVVVTGAGVSMKWDTTMQLIRYCEKALLECEVAGYVLAGSNLDIMLVLLDLQERHDEKISRIYQFVSQRLKYPIRMGVGHCYKELAQLYCSKEEAYEALTWGGEQLIIADIREVRDYKMVSASSLQNGRKRVIDCFQRGMIADLQNNLEILAEQVRASTVIHADAPYPTSIRRTMIEMLVEMMHIASDEGVDVDVKIGNVDPYRKIFELHSTPAIIQWVVEIAQTLSEAMDARKKQMEVSVLKQAQTYIQEHLSDIEMNLSTASQTVGMSPGYFSAFFIREAGMGFKEYVTEQRVKLAQRLLLESSDSINVISERCGFLSPSYFISVFKNQTGMTPGAYRKSEKLILRAE